MPRITPETVLTEVAQHITAAGGVMEYSALVTRLEQAGKSQYADQLNALVTRGELVASVVAVGVNEPAELRFSLPA